MTSPPPPSADDSSAYQWERITPDQPDHMPLTQRLMHVLADRTAWNAALARARLRREQDPAVLPPSEGRAA